MGRKVQNYYYSCKKRKRKYKRDLEPARAALRRKHNRNMESVEQVGPAEVVSQEAIRLLKTTSNKSEEDGASSSVEKIELNTKQRDKLIKLYKNEEVLWRRDHPSYNDRSMKSEAMKFEALIRIATAMDVPGLGSGQIKSLLQMYTDLFRKSLKIPKIYAKDSFWYQNMNFLENELEVEDDDEQDNLGANDGAQSDSSEDFIVEIKEEYQSDDEIQVDRLADSREVDALADTTEVEAVSESREIDALADFEETDRIAIDNTIESEPEDNYLTIDDLCDNEETTVQPSISGIPGIEPTFAKVFVHTTKHNAAQTESEELETGKQSRKRKKPNDDGAQDTSKIDKKLLDIVKSQKKIEELLQSQVNKKEDMFDNFAKYVGASLRAMGTYEALALQPKIVELITMHQSRKKTIADVASKKLTPVSRPLILASVLNKNK